MRCGDHQIAEYENATPRRYHCNKGHLAGDRNCSKQNQEDEIYRIRDKEKASYNIAEQIHFKRETSSTSYARRLKEGNRNIREEKDGPTESQEAVKKKAGAKRKRAAAHDELESDRRRVSGTLEEMHREETEIRKRLSVEYDFRDKVI